MKSYTKLLGTCFFISFGTYLLLFDYLEFSLSQLSPEDQIIAREAKLDTIQLIQLHNYRAESHNVETGDGYIITVHRIPSKKPNAIPLYLQHGAFGSSLAWVANGRDSIALLLANLGYDVWMGNFRGNVYSRRMTEIVTENEKFGWDKLGDYEIPAIVNHIRNITGHRQVIIIGYSMGTTSSFAALASNRYLNHKVKGVVALAPIVTARYLTSIWLTLGSYFHRTFTTISEAICTLFSLISSETRADIMLRFCLASSSHLCKYLLNTISGYNPNALNQTRIPVFASQIASETPDRSIYHWNQVRQKSYRMVGFDYGKQKNIHNYGGATPRIYDLTAIRVPVAIFYSANDAIATPIEVELLCRQLKNVIHKELLSAPLSHTDILWHNTHETVRKLQPILSKMWNMNLTQYDM